MPQTKEIPETREKIPEIREWTLMFYFASDNPLAPGIVTQLKHIKDAGFHPEANVIARFDPHADNTPSHIFDVNRINKIKANGECQIGFNSADPFVRSLVLDKLWGKEEINNRIQASLRPRNGRKPAKRGRRGKAGEKAEEAVELVPFNPPMPSAAMSGEQPPGKALSSFLDFCVEYYPARHYMLFILGHGVVVGNDLFLLDEHTEDRSNGSATSRSRNGNKEKLDEKAPARNSLLLKDLGGVLRRFKSMIGDSAFDLIGFHSCSMSGLEVAYEIQGTADYMLASQGPNFVGSWPYKQILIRMFNDLKQQFKPKGGVPLDVKEVCTKIFYYCLYNNQDFQLAGYSFDMTLCDLRKVTKVEVPLRALSKRLSSVISESLKKGADPLPQELILLAHWDAQSYFQESYTDLYDFCFRLHHRCKEASAASKKTRATLGAIRKDCRAVMKVLQRGVRGDDDGIIVRCEFAGPAFQYSHGLSLFFPWSEPTNGFFSERNENGYKYYEFKKTGWSDFLQQYFTGTMRQTHSEEDDPYETPIESRPSPSLEASLLEEITARILRADGQLDKSGPEDPMGGLEDKSGGSDPVGGCDCPSIKNYPSTTRARRNEQEDATKLPISPNFYAGIE